MENKLLGTIVEWENERWYVDNTDEEFKDDGEETSLFLLPEKYADADENDKLMRFGNPDSVGFWVYESLVKEIITEYWEVDLRSRKDGNSIETIFSGESHDDACACLQKWYDEHLNGDIESDREGWIDGNDGVFADIYCTDIPHGIGKWQ